MPLDPAYKDVNRASRKRIHALANRLTDEEMQTRVGEHCPKHISVSYYHR